MIVAGEQRAISTMEMCPNPNDQDLPEGAGHHSERARPFIEIKNRRRRRGNLKSIRYTAGGHRVRAPKAHRKGASEAQDHRRQRRQRTRGQVRKFAQEHRAKTEARGQDCYCRVRAPIDGVRQLCGTGTGVCRDLEDTMCASGASR